MNQLITGGHCSLQGPSTAGNPDLRPRSSRASAADSVALVTVLSNTGGQQIQGHENNPWNIMEYHGLDDDEKNTKI